MKKRKLYHSVPSWVTPGAIYHIRIRCESDNAHRLDRSEIATSVLRTVAHYHLHYRWYVRVFLLMPDHVHGLISFPPDKRMSNVVGKWKAYNKRQNLILWQENYFDHRIRNDTALDEKADYIRQNPVTKGLCGDPRAWPWVLDLNNVNEWI